MFGLSGGALDGFLSSKIKSAVHYLRVTNRGPVRDGDNDYYKDRGENSWDFTSGEEYAGSAWSTGLPDDGNAIVLIGRGLLVYLAGRMPCSPVNRKSYALEQQRQLPV